MVAIMITWMTKLNYASLCISALKLSCPHGSHMWLFHTGDHIAHYWSSDMVRILPPHALLFANMLRFFAFVNLYLKMETGDHTQWEWWLWDRTKALAFASVRLVIIKLMWQVRVKRLWECSSSCSALYVKAHNAPHPQKVVPVVTPSV